MIRAERLDTLEESEWERRVATFGGNPLHLPSVHLSECDRSSLLLLTVQHGETDVGCAIAIESKSRGRLRLFPGQRTLHLPTSPAIGDSAMAAHVRDSLIEYARNSGFDRLIVHPAYGRWLTDDETLSSYRKHSIVEFVLDLSPGEDAVTAGFHKTHRKNVRRAIKQGMTVEEDSSLEALTRLRELQVTSSERASRRAEGFAVRDEDYFRRVHENVYAPGLGHVLFATLNGERIAALAWLAATKRVLTVRSGSSPEGYRTRAMYLLYDELIRRSIRENMTELNAGGVPAEAAQKEHPQSGLYEFKHGFGGTPVIRHELEIPLEETAG